MRSILFPSSLAQPFLLSILLNILTPFLILSSIPTSPSLSSSNTHIQGSQAFLLDQCAMAVSALSTDARVDRCFPSKTWEALVLADDDVTPKLVNDTAADLCPRPICSPPTVALIENTINQNCLTSEEEKAGTNWLYGVSRLYIPLKEGMCQTVSPQNGTFCVTTLTENLSAYSAKQRNGKKFTWELFLNGTQLQRWIDDVPSSIVCTPCTQSMVNPIERYVTVHQLNIDPYVVSWIRFFQGQVIRKCGLGFIDTLPPPIPPPTDNASSRTSAFSLWAIVGVFSIAGITLLPWLPPLW